ncbi:MAG TPA: hypothetical protein VM821_03820 [Abditibacteriaceae bacterium]|nr:hypothetical protein [Abditibacteriaceae bacterium]
MPLAVLLLFVVSKIALVAAHLQHRLSIARFNFSYIVFDLALGGAHRAPVIVLGHAVVHHSMPPDVGRRVMLLVLAVEVLSSCESLHFPIIGVGFAPADFALARLLFRQQRCAKEPKTGCRG